VLAAAGLLVTPPPYTQGGGNAVNDATGTQMCAHATAGVPAAPQRGPGRPPTRPWEQFKVTTTILQIHDWRQTVLALALRVAVPAAALEAILRREKVPPELWDRVRAVIGRQRRYRGALGLTPEERQRMVELSSTPTDDDREKAERKRLMERLHGRKTAREIDLSLTRGSAGSSVAREIMPRRLLGLWLAFDTWGADQIGIRVKTFRDWRRWAVAADKRLPEGEQMLRSLWRREAPTAERHAPGNFRT
jgi:hypothetical protein